MDGDSVDGADLASEFAHYLRDPSAFGALTVAELLADRGDRIRSSLLTSYVEHGAHLCRAPWWESGALCWVDVAPPPAEARGQLWFDPIEATASLLVPWCHWGADGVEPWGHGFYSWVSLWPVQSWQQAAAHVLTRHLPASEFGGPIGEEATQTSGHDAFAYAALFGKGLAGEGDWTFLKAGYGDEVLARVWGEAATQFGGAGTISGSVEGLRRDDLFGWDPADGDLPIAEDVDELACLGLPFRTAVGLQSGLHAGGEIVRRISYGGSA